MSSVRQASELIFLAAFGVRWLVWLILPFVMVVRVAAAEDPPEVTSTAPCAVPPRIANTRPDPEGVPTRVSVGLYVIDIARIEDVGQTFRVDFALVLGWKDPRLGRGNGISDCTLSLGEVWNPATIVLNKRELVRDLDDIVRIDSQGNVRYAQRFSGNLSSPFNVKNFPLDRQVLPITIVSVRYGPDEVLFTVNEDVTGRADTFSIADWSIGPGTPRSSSVYTAAGTRDLSRFDYEFRAERLLGFYVWTVILPLALIVFMSWTVFWIDPAQLIPQVSISATSVLTVFAFQFTLADLLPRVPYVTRMDGFVAGSLISVFLALVEAVASCTLAGRGNRSLADRLDRWSRVVFPASFLVLAAFAFLA